MKHTRRRTRKRNFLARLQPARLSFNPGSWWTSQKVRNRSAIRKGPRVCHRNCVPQKIMDYYGIPNQIGVDMWSSNVENRLQHYIGHIRQKHGHEWKRVDYTAKVLKNERHRRNLRRFIKRYDLEHKLLHKV